MEFYDIDKFNTLEIAEDRLLFYVSKNHRLASRNKITIEEIDETPITLLNADSVQNTLIKNRFEAHKLRPNVYLSLSR